MIQIAEAFSSTDITLKKYPDWHDVRSSVFGQLSAGRRKYYQTIKFTHKYNSYFKTVSLGGFFSLRWFHFFSVFQIWHTSASICSALVFLWWSLATGALPSCRSGPLPTAALMMVNDAGNLPVWCSEYHMSWESEIDGYQDRWNSIKYQMKLGHRSNLIQSRITNMQIL